MMRPLTHTVLGGTMRIRRATAAAATGAALLVLTGCSSDDSKPLDQSAAVMCEGFVKKKLKSPGSAKFADVSETTIKALSDKKPWRYKVTAHVDSQNDFGALKRNPYVCTIHTKDNKNWTLDDLQFTDPK